MTVLNVKKSFKGFKTVTEDDQFLYLRKKGVGVIEYRGKVFGGNNAKTPFIVEKFGYRQKLFRGKNAVSNIKKYLGL